METPKKYRGRIADSKEWVYGSLLVYGDGEHNILVPREHNYKLDEWRVQTDTVGLCSGRKDKNGKEIYDGDIIMMGNTKSGVCEVRWVPNRCAFCLRFYYKDEGDFDAYTLGTWLDMEHDFEVIGNIYENPELLKPEE